MLPSSAWHCPNFVHVLTFKKWSCCLLLNFVIGFWFLQVGIISTFPLCPRNISCFFLDRSSSFQSRKHFLLRVLMGIICYVILGTCVWTESFLSCRLYPTSMWCFLLSFSLTELKGMMIDADPSKQMQFQLLFIVKYISVNMQR